MDRYKIVGKIGEGAHGVVLEGFDTLVNKKVAMKRVPINRIDDGMPIPVLREIKALQEVDCEHVVKLLDVFLRGLGFVLVFEFMPSGLWEMLNDWEHPLKEEQKKSYMIMLLKGVDYLHSHSIMHRDLKPANLLINKNGILKIADLGLASLFWEDEKRPYSHQVATRWYRSPELLYGARYYTKAVDLWAVGCILGEILNNFPLFPGETDIEQLSMILRALGTPTMETWPGMKELPDYNKITFPKFIGIPWNEILPNAKPEAIQLVSSFLVYNADKRTTTEKALIHPYFFSFPLPSPMSEMPRPEENHRLQFKKKQFNIQKPLEEMFKDANKILKREIFK